MLVAADGFLTGAVNLDAFAWATPDNGGFFFEVLGNWVQC